MFSEVNLTPIITVFVIIMIFNLIYLVASRNKVEHQLARLFKLYKAHNISTIHVIEKKVNQSSFLIKTVHGEKTVHMNVWGKVAEDVLLSKK